jgi:hypothetical protein
VGEAGATACLLLLLLLLLLEELKVDGVGCEQQLPLVPEHPPSAVQCRCCHPCWHHCCCRPAAAPSYHLLLAS